MTKPLTVFQTIRLSETILKLATDYNLGATEGDISEAIANIVIGHDAKSSAYLVAKAHLREFERTTITMEMHYA